MILRFAAAFLCIAILGCATGVGDSGTSRQQRGARPAGAFVVSGSSSTANFVRVWAAAYQREHPQVTIRVESTSSSAATQAMVRNAATLGMMSRPMNAEERAVIAKAHGSAPLELKVAIDAVGIFVFKDNPLRAISLQQIERIFSASAQGVKTWGDLGAGGEWAQRPIVAFGFDPGRGAYEVMRELALRGGAFRRSVIVEPVSSSVVQGVGMEAGGVGYASVFFRTLRTRVLPIETADGIAVHPTEEAVAAGKYPLARFLYLYCVPGAACASMRGFLIFVLSPEGQEIARAAGAFSISAELASGQRAALER